MKLRWERRKKETNSTGREFKEILGGDQKEVNAYRGKKFSGEKLGVHDFVFVLVLVPISSMDLGNLEEGRKDEGERKKGCATNDKDNAF